MKLKVLLYSVFVADRTTVFKKDGNYKCDWCVGSINATTIEGVMGFSSHTLLHYLPK